MGSCPPTVSLTLLLTTAPVTPRRNCMVSMLFPRQAPNLPAKKPLPTDSKKVLLLENSLANSPVRMTGSPSAVTTNAVDSQSKNFQPISNPDGKPNSAADSALSFPRAASSLFLKSTSTPSMPFQPKTGRSSGPTPPEAAWILLPPFMEIR